MLKPGVCSALDFFASMAGVSAPARVVASESLTGVRRSCPRLGERIAPVLSMTISLDWPVLGGEQAGDLSGDFPARLGDFLLNGEVDLRGLERLRLGGNNNYLLHFNT